VDQGSSDTVSAQCQISSENQDNGDPLPFRDLSVSRSTCVNRITTELPDGTGNCLNQNIFHYLYPCMRACTKHVKISHERNENKDPAIAYRSSCICAYANGALRATPDVTELRATHLDKDKIRVESNSGLRTTWRKRFDGIVELSMKGPSLTQSFPVS